MPATLVTFNLKLMAPQWHTNGAQIKKHILIQTNFEALFLPFRSQF